MTLRRFLDVAQAILVHEMVRAGVDLMTALEETRSLATGKSREEASTNGGRTAASNDAALTQLQQTMGGVSIG